MHPSHVPSPCCWRLVRSLVMGSGSLCVLRRRRRRRRRRLGSPQGAPELRQRRSSVPRCWKCKPPEPPQEVPGALWGSQGAPLNGPGGPIWIYRSSLDDPLGCQGLWGVSREIVGGTLSILGRFSEGPWGFLGMLGGVLWSAWGGPWESGSRGVRGDS